MKGNYWKQNASLLGAELTPV